jgi:hypothetical protein
MKKPQATLLGTVLSLGTVLVASGAAADSVVTYAGEACLGGQYFGTTGGIAQGRAFYSGYTRCPLTRINSDDTTDITANIIRVKDQDASTEITCYTVSCDGNGGTCDESVHRSTGISFTGTTYLNMGSVVAYSNGYAYIYCSFPTVSSYPSFVYSYRSTD